MKLVTLVGGLPEYSCARGHFVQGEEVPVSDELAEYLDRVFYGKSKLFKVVDPDAPTQKKVADKKKVEKKKAAPKKTTKTSTGPKRRKGGRKKKT